MLEGFHTTCRKARLGVAGGTTINPGGQLYVKHMIWFLSVAIRIPDC